MTMLITPKVPTVESFIMAFILSLLLFDKNASDVSDRPSMCKAPVMSR